MRAYKQDHPDFGASEQGPVEWAEYEKLKREMAEVKRENEFLKAVSAYFVADGKK